MQVMPAGPHEDDRQLARRLLGGDEAAFQQFFETYSSRLYRLASARVSGDEDAAEEVVQLTLSKALAKIGTYRGEAALFTWLCTFCRHELSDLGEYGVEYLKRRSPSWRVFAAVQGHGDEISLITEAQWHLGERVFLRFNREIGLTSRANDWEPQFGVLITLPTGRREGRSR